MRVFATKEFSRFARKVRLSDAKLLRAASEVEGGQFDADLGGGVFKQRVAREGAGKSGGFRTILVFRAGSRCVFVLGFAKNAKASITARELKALKQLADVLLNLNDDKLLAAAAAGELIEVVGDGDEKEGRERNPRLRP